jgi:hypothetical protein
MRSSPSKATLKRLFALSGNRCAFPGCGLPVVDPGTGNLCGAPVHINAVSPGGPRYDPRQTDEQRESVENLLLLCATRLLGEVISWTCSGVAVTHPALLTALRDAGLDEGVARELAPKYAFTRACK